MPILSHLHPLFHAETCHAYIHTLAAYGTMPATEIATGCVDCVLSLDHIAPALVTMVTSMALYSVPRGIVSSVVSLPGLRCYALVVNRVQTRSA